MASPTSRSLDKLRKEGWLADVVEKWVPQARVRKDLFGFIDILCLKDGVILGVQATSGSNLSARVKKITEHENIAEVRKAGIRIEVWGWRKNAKGRWMCRIEDVS